MKKSIKKLLSIVCLFALMLSFVFTLTACNSINGPVIGIVQYVTHDSLDTIRDACIAELKEQGYEDGKNCKIILENGNADASTIATIMATLKNKKADVIIAIATPTAVEAVKYSDKIPVVFSAVSDPTDILSSGTNITGTSDAIQVSLILDYIKEVMQTNEKPLNKLGFIYNPSEANSVTNLGKIQEYLKDSTIELKTKTISKSSELQLTAEALVTDVDAIFITDDNTVASAMSVLANVGKEKKIPVFCGVDSEVNDGGLATIGINYELLGKETGNMAARILNGEKASDIPYKVFDTGLKLYVNETTLAAIEYTLPEYKDGETVYFR